MNRRDERVAETLGQCVADLAPSGDWLVVDERTGEVAKAISDLGGTPHVWSRTPLQGNAGSAWPEARSFDGAVVRLPKGREALRMTLHVVADRLKSDGMLLVGGANDEGIRSAASDIEDVAQTVETRLTRRHCRVFEAKPPRSGLMGDPDAWKTNVEAHIGETTVRWDSWPGLFAHGRIDPGTARLLACLPAMDGQRVWDFACGAGAIGGFLRARGDRLSALHLSDIDALAVYAAERNVPGAVVHHADGLIDVHPPFDVLVSNPPLHQGKASDATTLYGLIAGAPSRLKKGGQLWMVVQGAMQVERPLRDAFKRVRRVRRDARYAVWCAET